MSRRIRHVVPSMNRRPLPARARRALRAALHAAVLGALAAACSSAPKQVPLSVHLQATPRILRLPPGVVRNADGTPRAVDIGQADAFNARVAPALERWGLDIRLVIEPAYVAAILLKESAYDTLAVGAEPAYGLAQLTPAEDAELLALARTPAYAWMNAEAGAWPRDSALHDVRAPQGAAAVRARLAARTLTSRTEYLFDPERSARAAIFWVKILEDRWKRDPAAGGYAAFARGALGDPRAGNALTDDQVLDLVTVSYGRGAAWTRTAVEKLGRDWARRLPELGAPGAAAADYLERVRFYTRLLGGDPSAYDQLAPQRGRR